MSEEQTKIQNEYNALCANAGHTQYQISVLKRQLNEINERLRVLNEQAAELVKLSEKKENE